MLPDRKRYFSDGTDVYVVGDNYGPDVLNYFKANKEEVLTAFENGAGWKPFRRTWAHQDRRAGPRRRRQLRRAQVMGRSLPQPRRPSWPPTPTAGPSRRRPQQLVTQDLVKDLGNFINLATNADQRIERLMGAIVASF